MSRLPTRARIETDAGSEIQCSKCKEFWPEEPEFYFIHKTKGAHSWCKACYLADPKVALKRQRAIDKIAAARAAARGATA
jgi:hypothetical protein